MYDYYDYGMPYEFWWMLSRGYIFGILIYGGFFLYIFPLLQALVQQQNKLWLNSTLSRVKSLDADTKSKILAEAEPEFKEPLYKLTKLQYLVSGIITMIVGILVIVLEDPDEDTVKALVWLPLLVGAGVNAAYFYSFKNIRLWKEAAGFFGILGICITIPGIFAVYEWDWMRSDLLVYLVLILSLALVHILESTVASLFYMIAVAIGSSILTLNTSIEWLTFLKSFIWFFALAPLVFWMPKLKSNKEVGVKEIAFGVVFMIMMITVTLTNLGALRILGLAVIIPVLYMFSKVHFKQSGWFLTKPIQTLIVILTFYGIVAFSFEEVLGSLPSFSYQFLDHFSFSWLVDLLIIVAMVFGGIMLFRDNFEDDLDKINLVVLGFAPVAYILSFLADYYANFLFLAAMGMYGWSYLKSGLENKSVFAVMLGGMGVISVLPLIYAQLPSEVWEERVTIGFMVTIYGGTMVAMALYLRSQWQVTNDDLEDATPPLPSTSSEVLDDNTDI